MNPPYGNSAFSQRPVYPVTPMYNGSTNPPEQEKNFSPYRAPPPMNMPSQNGPYSAHHHQDQLSQKVNELSLNQESSPMPPHPPPSHHISSPSSFGGPHPPQLGQMDGPRNQGPPYGKFPPQMSPQHRPPTQGYVPQSMPQQSRTSDGLYQPTQLQNTHSINGHHPPQPHHGAGDVPPPSGLPFKPPPSSQQLSSPTPPPPPMSNPPQGTSYQSPQPMHRPPQSSFQARYPPMPQQPNMPPGPTSAPPQPINQQPPNYPPSPPQYQQPPHPGLEPPPPQYSPHYPAAPPLQGGYPPQYGPNSPNAMAHRANFEQIRKLDPENMPSPIQVIEDDKKNKSGEFFTGAKGVIPPLVTTNFIARDEGICSPRFIRSTIYAVPSTNDTLQQSNVPFAITISPFAQLNEREMPPPISDLGELGPVRCNRCRVYMCPYMQFIDGGRRFHCVFCKATTDVPAEYFAHLDHNGMRSDMFERPELCLGSYEFVATKQYCKNEMFPNPPAFIFMIDVSYNSIRNGMVKLLCSNLKSIIKSIPRPEGEPSKLKVGFVTYSNVVHFYSFSGVQPKLLTVPDVSDMFMPLLTGFLVSLEQAEASLDSLFELIPAMFGDTKETETILGPVIQAGFEALKAANCAGKLFIFHSSLPSAEAPGKLKSRDDRKLLGTDKEKTILMPQSKFYSTLGQECVTAGCCVDLFLFPNAYIDVATLGQVCKMTGGQVFKYQYFQSDVDGEQFLDDLQKDVAREIGFDAVMRVRTSTGIRATDFYGNFSMSNATDLEFGAIDSDKAITALIKYDDKLSEEDGVYIQSALLYTSISGQRRLRIHNLSLPVKVQMADLFRSCELDTIMNFLAKKCVSELVDQTSRVLKDKLVAQGAQLLACYRKNCSNPSSAGQLILPECMKLLPLYLNCLLKSDALSGGSELLVDDRSLAMYQVGIMKVEASVPYLYPRLLPLHNLSLETNDLPIALRCLRDKIQEDGAYLLENGHLMFIYIGGQISPEWLMEVFNVQSLAHLNTETNFLAELDTPLSRRIWNIIRKVREERQRHMKLILVKQGDKKMVHFYRFLVEDETTGASYVDFLCHLHKEIRNLLN